ncbi:aldose 1-epimerase [Winogradskyella tangerina]|uniref:aldose 1-epimerase n=1 Tax=Winogradskyella tangerina TaxID=2023240 RepID=UPI000DBE33C6|nr:aldose 1-epimerase [Winogradskyella tangerina]
MYQIQEFKSNGSDFIVLENADKSNQLTINLNEGGRVTLFKHQGHIIISDLETTSYSENFAAAILFPFANRIKDGMYSFKNNHYELPRNEGLNQNAIHGLVYDQLFSIGKREEKESHGLVALSYENQEFASGFPFRYLIEFTYVLSDFGLKLKFNIKNVGENTFPFTLGWHPYFKSTKISESYLKFHAINKFVVDDRGIVTGKSILNEALKLQLGDVVLDDVYEVSSNMAEFVTPMYKVKIQTVGDDNYLQIFTPKESNAIAIEPMVGISDSFNHKIGLKELAPNKNYQKEWSLAITSLIQNKK